jgi:hypothetical protein
MFGLNGQGSPSIDGHTLLWARMPQIVLDAASIALMADYMSIRSGQRHQHDGALHEPRQHDPLRHRRRSGTSSWILCDTHIDLVPGGIAHGTCHIWSEHGRLLAVASQSMTISSIKDTSVRRKACLDREIDRPGIGHPRRASRHLGDVSASGACISANRSVSNNDARSW